MSSRRRYLTIDDMALLTIAHEISEIEQLNLSSQNLVLLGGVNRRSDELPNPGDYSGRFTISEAFFKFESEGIGDISLHFRRAASTLRVNDPRHVDYIPSEKFIELEFTVAPNPQVWVEHTDVLDRVYAAVEKYTSIVDGASNDSDNVIAQLTSGFAASSKAMLDDIRNAELALEERRRNLDEDFLKRERERREEHDNKLAELDAKIEEFERQSHMAERRRLLRSMSDKAATDGVSTQMPTRMVYARWAVFFAALIGAFIAAWMSISGFQQLTSDVANLSSESSTYWVLLGKGVLSSAIAIFAVVFAVNWMRSFYEDDVGFSKSVNQFNYDINRASWIIETILEVQHEAKGEVPETWIDRVTSNLFGADNSSRLADTKSELVDTLFGVSGSMKVGPDGPVLEFSRRDLGKLKKQLDALNAENP